RAMEARFAGSSPTAPATDSGSDAQDSQVVVVEVLEAVLQTGDGTAREVAGDGRGDDQSVGCLVDVGDSVLNKRDAGAPSADGGEAVVFSALVFDRGVFGEQSEVGVAVGPRGEVEVAADDLRRGRECGHRVSPLNLGGLAPGGVRWSGGCRRR